MAMPPSFKEKDPVEAYRSYYIFEKNHLFSWKKRDEPDFVKEFRSYFE